MFNGRSIHPAQIHYSQGIYRNQLRPIQDYNVPLTDIKKMDMINPMSDPTFYYEYMKQKDIVNASKSNLTPATPIKPWIQK